MLTRKRLLTAVMCGGLLTTAAFIERAGASGLLQPNSDWAVSKLEAAQAGGAPYCALARRFSNNLILTLARNSYDESSLAIDFQKTALNNTQSYHITISPGFGQDRAFNVRPVSGKALVIRLGQDYAFHDALNRSGKLAVDISGETYSFNLPDFADGQKKLSECLITLVEPAAGKESAALIPPPPVSKRDHYMTASDNNVSTVPPQVSVSSAEVQALREENLRLRGALERERRIYEDRIMQESQNSSVSAELHEKLRILEMENGQLKQQLAYKPVSEPLSCPTPDTSVADALQSEITALRDENLLLKQDIAAQRAQYALIEKQLEEANANQPSKDDIAITEALRSRIEVLEEENKALKVTNVSASSGAVEGTVSLSQLRSLEEQLRYVQADRDKLRAQMDAIADGKQEGLLDISTDNWNLEQATRRFNEAEREIRRLGRQLEEQRTQCAAKQKELEYMLFDPEVAEKEQISKLLKLESLNNEYADQISSLELEKAEFEQKLAMVESELANIETAAGQSQIDEAEMARLQVENETLRNERNSLMTQKTDLSQRITTLENQLFATEASARNASSQQYSQMAAEIQSLRDERNQLMLQKTDLSQRIAVLENDMAANQAAAQKSNPEQIANMAAQIEALRDERNNLMVQKTELTQRLAGLESELIAASATTSKVDHKQITMLEAENAELRRKQDDLRLQKETLIEKIASLEGALASIPTGSGSASLPAPVAAEPVSYQGQGYAANNASYNYEQQEVSYKQNFSPSTGNLISAAALQSMLERAQIPVQSSVEQIDGSREQGFAAFSWDTGDLFGSAEQQISDMGRFDEMVSNYLGKTKSRCQGDFASVPILAEDKGTLTVSSYEIACVGAQGGAAASIVFYNDNGVFTTIAHETGLEAMDAAMDARDSLTSMLLHSQIASN